MGVRYCNACGAHSKSESHDDPCARCGRVPDDQPDKYVKLNNPELYSLDERLEALVQAFEDRVHGPNGPAHSAYNDAARMLQNTIDNKEVSNDE